MSLSHAPNIVRNGLVLYLDAANSRSYPGTGTTWTDLSGNGNNGTLTNGPTYSSLNNGSIVFNGSNQHVIGPSISSQFTGDMTAEVWINIVSGPSDWVRVVGTGEPGNRTFGLWYGTGRAFLWQRLGATDPGIYATGNSVATSTWNHVVGTTSGSSHVLYLNGVQIGSATAAGPWPASNQPIGIGYGNIHTYHNGNISNVKLYNRALSISEVRQNFNATKGRYGL